MELSNTTTRRLGLASMRASKSWRPSNILAPMMLSGGLSNTALQYAGVSSMMRRCDDDLVMTQAPRLTSIDRRVCCKAPCDLDRAIDSLSADGFVHEPLPLGIMRIERNTHKDVHQRGERSDRGWQADAPCFGVTPSGDCRTSVARSLR